MEKNDKKIKTAYATIMILIAVIIVLCGLVLYDKFFKVENYEVNKSDKKNIQKEEENIKMHQVKKKFVKQIVNHLIKREQYIIVIT